MCLAVVWSTALAQNRTVTGKVTEQEGGTPLPGVNVSVKGTSLGTITDAEGKYSLSVPSDGGVLMFSFIGLVTQELDLAGRSTVDVAMSPDVHQLGEVVVTAVGIEREKKALGYAVSNVTADRIAQKSEPDVVKSLQGKVAGVNIVGAGGAVGAGTNFTIRGNKSLLGNNQPLFVVDGVPFNTQAFATGSFTSATTASSRSLDIDPNIIESMTILKGAAASAIYGSRAANGVVVITTKASSKATHKGLEISLNTSYSVEEVANLPEYQTRYTQGNNFLYVDGNIGVWGAPFDLNDPVWKIPQNANTIYSIDPSTGLAWVAHPYDRYNDPTSKPYFPQYAGDSVLLRPYNSAKNFFQRGSVFETAVSVSGGNEKARVTGGISRTRNVGIVPSNEGTRTSVNFGGNVQLDNGLYVVGSMNYVNSDLNSPPTSGLYTNATSITQRLLFIPPNVDLKGLPYQDATGYPAFYRPDNDNPYFLAYNSRNTSKVDRFYGKLSLGYDFTDWLNVTYQMGFNGFNQHNITTLPIGSTSNALGQVIQDDIRNMELDGNLLITVNKDLSEDLSLKAIVGHNLNKRRTDRQAFFGNRIIVPGIIDLDNTANVTPFGGGVSERRFYAYFADLSFSYKDYLFLNLTGRNDVTSTLPKSSRSYFYGGVSSSFIFSDAFKLNSNVLTNGKLRASIGRTGADVSPYQTQAFNYFTNNGLGNNIAAIGFPFKGQNVQTVGDAFGNPNLTPEFTTEWELGTELNFFDSRISVDFAYYDRKTTNQIVPITAPGSSGYTSRIVNIGKVTNKGIEVALGLNPVRLANGFRWDINAVFTRNRNMVVELADGLDEVFVNGYSNSVQVVHKVGSPFGQIKGTVAARSDDGKLLVDPSTGKLITSPNSEIIGDPNPDFMLGVTNTFSWKGVTLGVLLDYKKGGDIWSGTYNQVYGRGLTPGTIPNNPHGREVTMVIPGVLGDPLTQKAILDDQGNTIPNGTQLTTNDWFFINTFGSGGPEEFSVFDGTTIRLREISLGYQLPKAWLSKTPFGSVNISLSGRNLWFNAVNMPKDLHFDPETTSLGAGDVQGLQGNLTGNAQGVDLGIIPTTKRYGVNLRITF
ncbi:SusC/RagA family TonB-linked outer membrane protein [Chryseolinea sp. Jin1]|uniref:SusC/RagA family TonB-linked outer membrane protein n=2 Tax=Chryseolinea lacunae TaxID=2801331 RepID=A0ABS1KK00_9BACT|nr:SusC/RagA family TonB-linked outer membrane protein [Chryseolinea lacunae]